jgi:hypothetical protein
VPVRVANIWKHHRSDTETRVYIGRACRGYPRSPLANPFRKSEVGSKDAAITAYREWLRGQLSDSKSEAAQEVIRLGRLVAEGAEITMLCWCSPASCHGDVVKEAVERMAERLGKPSIAGDR